MYWYIFIYLLSYVHCKAVYSQNYVLYKAHFVHSHVVLNCYHNNNCLLCSHSTGALFEQLWALVYNL